MEKLMNNIYIIKCAIYLAIGVYSNFNGINGSIAWFSLAFLMAIFHLDVQINNKL